jgi:hypothetical protein
MIGGIIMKYNLIIFLVFLWGSISACTTITEQNRLDITQATTKDIDFESPIPYSTQGSTFILTPSPTQTSTPTLKMEKVIGDFAGPVPDWAIARIGKGTK